MYDYVIAHASYGSPFEHWIPWLFKNLTDEGKSVLAPQFPCGTDIQTYEAWAKVMDAYRNLIDENTSFIGHSIGPAFICSYLADNNLKAKDLFLIAPFYDIIDITDYDHVNSTFLKCDKLISISDLTRDRYCYISKDDPYVPNKLAEDFIKTINGKAIYKENSGHFNTMSGYTTFKELLKNIRNCY